MCVSPCCRTAASPTAAARASTSGTSAASWSPSATRSRCSPASPTPTSTRGSGSPRCPASTSTASPTRSATPKPREIRDLIDVEEVLTMWTAGFPEPKTFSTRVARLLRDRARRLRRRPRQPGARLRDARDRDGPGCRWSPPSTTRSPSTAASTSPPRPTLAQEADAAPLVRLPADAGQGRPAGAARSSPRRSPRAATSSATSASTPSGSRRSCSASTTSSSRRPRRGCPAGSSRWPAPTRR